MDAVEAANIGHPGMPMGMADAATVLWTEYLKHDPADPKWPDRDRFVLSAGHGSMLIYALLHLTGYARPTIEDIARLPPARQPLRRPSREFPARRRRGDHRPARPGPRDGGRHGDRRAPSQRRVRRRPGRSPDLGGRRRRLPDGGRQPRGGGPCRPSRPGPADRLLGRQPHHHRRRRPTFPPPRTSRRATAAYGWHVVALRRPRRRRRPPRDRRSARRPAPVADRLPHDHRLRRAQQAGHGGHPRRRARRRRGRRRARGARLGLSAVRNPAELARRLARGREAAAAGRMPNGASASPPARERDEFDRRMAGRLPEGSTPRRLSRRASPPTRRTSPPANPRSWRWRRSTPSCPRRSAARPTSPARTTPKQRPRSL